MHSIRGVYVQSWSPSSSHALFPPDICMFSTPVSLLRTETEKVAIADCVPLQSGRWCALSLLVEILETIFGVKSKAWKSSPSIYRLCIWSNFFSEMEVVICTNYKQSAGFGDGAGERGETDSSCWLHDSLALRTWMHYLSFLSFIFHICKTAITGLLHEWGKQGTQHLA